MYVKSLALVPSEAKVFWSCGLWLVACGALLGGPTTYKVKIPNKSDDNIIIITLDYYYTIYHEEEPQIWKVGHIIVQGRSFSNRISGTHSSSYSIHL